MANLLNKLVRCTDRLVESVTLPRTSSFASGPGVDCFYLGHHKCATRWMRLFLRELCQLMKYNYISVRGEKTNDISSRWRKHTFYLYVNSDKGVLESIPDEARGFHLIRDPRDVLISGYFSHRNSHKNTWPKLMEQRRYLKSHNLEEGLLYMLDHSVYFYQMKGWMLGSRPNILDVKYEDLLSDTKGMFAKVLRHLNITIPDKTLEGIVEKCSFKNLSGGRARGQEDPHSHYRKGMGGDWKNYLKEGGVVYNAFYERYGHLVCQLGYE